MAGITLSELFAKTRNNELMRAIRTVRESILNCPDANVLEIEHDCETKERFESISKNDFAELKTKVGMFNEDVAVKISGLPVVFIVVVILTMRGACESGDEDEAA